MKTYSLYKRDEAGNRIPNDQLSKHRERPWHFKFTFRGQTYRRGLDTPDADEAQRRARLKAAEITDATLKGEDDRIDQTKTRQTVHDTLATLLDAYETCPVFANAKTRHHNVNCMKNLLAQVTGKSRDALLTQPYPSLINAATTRAWFALPNISPASQNSIWRQAASICAPRARGTYEALKIGHPSLGEFLVAGKMCTKKVKRSTAPTPGDDIEAATVKAWEACEDRNLFLAIGHMLAFGLRVGELEQCRWSWWVTKYGAPMLCGLGQFKGEGSALSWIEISGLDPYYTILRTKAIARGWMPKPTDSTAVKNEYVIAGHKTFRTDDLERAVSAWMRGLGWRTKKTNHALRAFAGGQVATKYGIYVASTFLRHSSVKVTEGHYMYLTKLPTIDRLRDACPVKWATVASAAPVLTVLELPAAVSA